MLTCSSAHVHTPYCDGKSTTVQMVQAAQDLGFVSLGFSSHAPQSFDPAYCMQREAESAYQQEVLSLKKQYDGILSIYLGIERDYFSSVSPDGYDYFIASCHYFLKPEGFYAVDGPPAGVQSYVERYCSGDGLKFAQNYYNQLQEYVLAFRPPIIGHIDLLRKNNKALGLFDEESPEYQKIALNCLHILRETDAILEINTGAVARVRPDLIYPATFLLKAWQKMKGKIMLNSDCHDARFLACHYDEAESLMRACGYSSAVRLGKNALWEEYSLME